MSIAHIFTRATNGINAPLITVETHISYGTVGFSIVGLPETAVKESKDRIRSALISNHFEFPLKRITVNLAPADLPKEGSRFDLPIALSILIASQQIPNEDIHQYEFAGELGLTGELRAVKGMLPFAVACKAAGRSLIVAKQNAEQTSLARARVLPATHLLDVCAHLKKQRPLTEADKPARENTTKPDIDFADIKGQEHAKQALIIAASGQHNLLLNGPPGTGKTMLAQRLATILPTLNHQQALTTAMVYSLSAQAYHWPARPFRSPHHSASTPAIIGGGNPPKPGEISLAHNGILFLDELPEFNRSALEALREPIETRHINISRATKQAQFPAHFQLVAAMNPCPCGFAGDSERYCSCTPTQLQRYQRKLSGPLLDRIDLHLTIPRLNYQTLTQDQSTMTSAQARERVVAAQNRQHDRQQKLNSELSNKETERYCTLTKSCKTLLSQICEKKQLSMRVYYRIIKVARTVADIECKEQINENHIAQAVSFQHNL